MSTNGHTTVAPPILLSIAGFDPSCGAGIVAALRLLRARLLRSGGDHFADVQNTQGVEAVTIRLPRNCADSWTFWQKIAISQL